MIILRLDLISKYRPVPSGEDDMHVFRLLAPLNMIGLVSPSWTDDGKLALGRDAQCFYFSNGKDIFPPDIPFNEWEVKQLERKNLLQHRTFRTQCVKACQPCSYTGQWLRYNKVLHLPVRLWLLQLVMFGCCNLYLGMFFWYFECCVWYLRCCTWYLGWRTWHIIKYF